MTLTLDHGNSRAKNSQPKNCYDGSVAIPLCVGKTRLLERKNYLGPSIL